MVLTNNQIIAFFSKDAQMGLSNPKIARLATEGIFTILDLSEFHKENIDALGWLFVVTPQALPLESSLRKDLL